MLNTNSKQVELLSEQFKLLGDLGRLTMVLTCLNGPYSVTELATTANLSQSLASHHLRHLREARILKARREGKQVLYELQDDHIRCVLMDMLAHSVE